MFLSRFALLLVGLTGGLEALLAESSVVTVSTTAQQAILKLVTDQTGPCTVKVSAFDSFSEGYEPVHDVNSQLFDGSDQCIREGNQRQDTEWTLVIGKRSADLAADKRKYSRSLANSSVYYYEVRVGEDVVRGNFNTGNILAGRTYADVPYDRDRPGEYAWPTIDFSDISKSYVDPKTGLEYRRIAKVEDIHYSAVTVNAVDVFALGEGWNGVGEGQTRASFGGGISAPAFFRAAALGQKWGGIPIWLEVELGATGGGAGAGRELKVCLTTDGKTCAGRTVDLTMEIGRTSYKLGNQKAAMDFWNLYPQLSLTQESMRTAAGNLSKKGKILTWESGNYMPLGWGAGSRIRLGSKECLLEKVQSQLAATLDSGDCVADGSYAYEGRNFGLLVWKANQTPDSILVYDVKFKVGLTTQFGWPSYGGAQLCSPVEISGPEGPGYVCVLGSTVHSEAGYFGGLATYYISKAGKSRSLGLLLWRAGTGFRQGACSGDFLAWDRNKVAVYCMSAVGNQLVKGTYLGNYAEEVVESVDSYSARWEWQGASGDLNQAAAAFQPGFQIGNNECKSGWLPVGMARNNHVIVNCSQAGQDSPGWVGVYDTQAQRFAALHASWKGNAGAGNRWGVLHSVYSVGDEDFVMVNSVAGGSPSAYQANLTAGSLNGSFSACPVDSYDTLLSGQIKCGVVTVDSLVLKRASDGQSLQGEPLRLGDYLFVMVNRSGNWGTDNEIVRIQKMNGNQLTVERLSRGANSCCEGLLRRDHIGSLALAGISSGWKEYWWNYVADPSGQGLKTEYGNTTMNDPDAANCHQVYLKPVFIASCPKQPNDPAPPVRINGVAVRNGELPGILGQRGRLVDVNFNAGNEGVNHRFDWFEAETHPARGHMNASQEARQTTIDLRPYAGNTSIGDERNWTAMGQQLYRLSATAGAGLKYDKFPLLMTTGEIPVVDISPGPIRDDKADAYKGCYVVKAGDCVTGSKEGEVYMNAPLVAVKGCKISRFSNGGLRDLCVTNHTFAHGGLQQFTAASSPNGETVRRLGSGFAPYKIQSVFWNARQLPDNSWAMIPVEGLGGTGMSSNWGAGLRTILLAKIPEWPAADLAVVAGNKMHKHVIELGDLAGATQARVSFGYRENGKVSDYFCSPRQVACVAGKIAGWQDQTVLPVACESGCRLTVPVIPGRVLYYRVERLKADGGLVLAYTKVLAVL